MIHIVSPHIDDAILSLGGLLLKLKARKTDICIHYVFSDSMSGVPDLKSNENQEIAVSASTKKLEEKMIAEKVGYNYIFYDLPDKTLRNTDDENQEQLVGNNVEELLAKKINRDRDIVFFPLGLADPDHQKAREVGISMFYIGYKVLFYEDMPDASQYDFEVLMPLAQRKGFDSESVSIDMERKLDLIRSYGNEISKDGIKDLKNYAYHLGEDTFYERFWKPRGFTVEFLK